MLFIVYVFRFEMALFRKRQNHLENNDNISTLLPHKQPKREFSRNYYITLAKESPKHSEGEESSEYASGSEYDDGIHGQETGEKKIFLSFFIYKLFVSYTILI